MVIETIVTFIVLGLSTLVDIIQKRIPNWITFPSILTGILYSVLYTPDWPEKIIILILLFFFGMAKLMGLGDIKLLMALFVWNPTYIAAFTFLAASLLAILAGEIKSPGNTQKSLTRAYLFAITRSLGAVSSQKIVFAPYLLFGYIIVKDLLIKVK